MLLEKFKPGGRDTWSWTLARIPDVPEMVHLAQSQFEKEVDSVFTCDPMLYSKNLSLAVIRQSFHTHECQVIIARDTGSGKLMAYSWLNRGYFMPYAAEEAAEAAFLHMDLELPKRTRVTLMAQVLQQWHLWCQIWCVPVLISTTIREDQAGFLRLHEAAGFTIRGSTAFMKVKNI
jgi:hypothetical protein